MIEKNEFDLLTDLAKLIKKYGPGTFESLAAHFSSPNFTRQMSEILSTTAKATRVTRDHEKSVKAKQAKLDFRSLLLKLEASEPEKSVLLIQLYEGLMAASFLPTLREMKAFLSDNGLPDLKSTARDKAIIQFVRMFLSMPTEEIKPYLDKLQPTSGNDDRSLEGWSAVIFRKEEPSAQNGKEKK